MNIAIDALGIGQPGGGRTATLVLLQSLLHLDDSNRYHVWLSAPEPELTAPHCNLRQHILPIRQRFVSRLALQAALPAQVRRDRIALVHFAKNLTVAVPTKTIVTVYDLSVMVYPQMYPASDRLYWRHVQPRALRRANHLVAISQRTSQDLRQHYQISASQISVVYPSCQPSYRLHSADEVEAARQRLNLPAQYVLHVGAISPKKNLTTLLRAFALARQKGYTGQLVLAGPRYTKLRDEALPTLAIDLGIADCVHFTGAVPQADLPALYACASLFVFPSLYEGFGIAPLEAMACGVPTIVADAGSTPEVVGESGLIARNPTDANELAHLMLSVLMNPSAAAGWSALSLQRAKMFGREAAAQQLLHIYQAATATK
jgi:glycosyltransferase involved in cell wall biosynthesis